LWHPSYIVKEEFEGTKGVIGIRKSKDRQHNGQTTMDKRIDNDPQNNTQKAKDWAMRIPLNTGSELRWTVRVGTDTRRVILGTHAMIHDELRKHREVLKTRGAYLWSVVTQKFSKD
jgi:hypothetical protein